MVGSGSHHCNRWYCQPLMLHHPPPGGSGYVGGAAAVATAAKRWEQIAYIALSDRQRYKRLSKPNHSERCICRTGCPASRESHFELSLQNDGAWE